MWTIGRSQRVEEKKYRPIVRKIRYSFSKSTKGSLKGKQCDTHKTRHQYGLRSGFP